MSKLDAIGPEVLASEAAAVSKVRYALGWCGEGGYAAWFLAREFQLGNLMATPDPIRAHTWESPEAIAAWAEGLTKAQFAQIADRDLFVFPIVAIAAEPAQRFRWTRVTEAEAGPEAEKAA